LVGDFDGISDGADDGNVVGGRDGRDVGLALGD
jgi:hypothetical protein